MRFPWSKQELTPPTAPEDWTERELWVGWEAPRNYIAGEASYAANLSFLAGPVCAEGYCFPVVVDLIREPENPYDPNAFRAEVRGVHIGYLRRHLAAQFAGPLDARGHVSFLVCGLIRGGTETAPNLGCHIWLDRSLTAGINVTLEAHDEYVVPWPPTDTEARSRLPSPSQ